jgi:hypothetical protein
VAEDAGMIRAISHLVGSMPVLFLLSCSQKPHIKPPFEPNDGIQAKVLIDLEEAPSGMQGSGYEYIVWKLGTNTEAIAAATSNNLVRNNLYWQQAQTFQLKQAIDIMAREPANTQVRPLISDILSAPDLRFALESYSSLEKPPYAAVWICSPSLNKIAYLHTY